MRQTTDELLERLLETGVEDLVACSASCETLNAQRDPQMHTMLVRVCTFAWWTSENAGELGAHLTAAPGAKVTITLEIEATTPDGFDESSVRTVSENVTTLKFDQSGFEEQ